MAIAEGNARWALLLLLDDAHERTVVDFVLNTLPAGRGGLGFLIGDASGHGLPAALVARDVLVGLRMGVEKAWKVCHVLEKLNRVVGRGGQHSSFVSLFWVNAGHCPPLHVGRDASRMLHTGDPVLGPMPAVRFSRRVTHLRTSPGAAGRGDQDAPLVTPDSGGARNPCRSGPLPAWRLPGGGYPHRFGAARRAVSARRRLP